MTFVAAIMAFLLFGWTAPDGARAMIPRDAPVSVIAARYASSATGDGTLVAEYDYDPYGRLIRETGPQAASCPFRYSTKWYDPDLGLLYYGYRWYDAASLKWLTPDPIGERGGANLTAFCDGDPVNQVDPLGLAVDQVVRDFRINNGVPEVFEEDQEWHWYTMGGRNDYKVIGNRWRAAQGRELQYFLQTGGRWSVKDANARWAIGWQHAAQDLEPARKQFEKIQLGYLGTLSACVGGAQAIAVASEIKAAGGFFLWYHGAREAGQRGLFWWLGTLAAAGGGANMQAPVSAPPVRQANSFYVTPEGVAVPATGYRFFSGDKNLSDAMSGVLPRRPQGMYVGFSEYATDMAAGRALQIPYNPRYRVAFDTLEYIPAMRVPYTRLDTGTQLEPYTFSYPEFGAGGAAQAKVFADIFVMPESLVPLIHVNAPLARPLVQEIPLPVGR